MATVHTGFIQQVPGLGTQRSLNQDEIEHVVFLLRVIEQLPTMSDTTFLGNGSLPTYEAMLRCLDSIHSAHLDLAEMVGRVLRHAMTEVN